MRTLVIGGAASGKSEYAEALAVRCLPPSHETAPATRYYIATMMPFSREDDLRIEKHRLMRAEKGFITMERYTDMAGLVLPRRGTVLLECLGNLTANELFSDNGAGDDTAASILRGVEALAAQCHNLVVVSNDVFCDGISYDEGTRRYIDILAGINRTLAARFDSVVELVCGIPLAVKGSVM